MFEKSVRISTEKEIETYNDGASPTSESGSSTTAIPSPTTPTQLPQCLRAKDPAKDLEHPLHGWPELARLIAKKPDFEAFQSFKDLNIKSLLYYQAELDQLREDLHRVEWGDYREGHNFGKHVGSLLVRKDSEDKKERKQIDLVIKIRGVLKEYNDAVLQYAQISALPKAHRLNVDSLRTWLSHSSGGNIQIQGHGAHTWGHLTQKEPKKPPLKHHFLSLLRSLVWTKKSEKDELDLMVPCAGREVDGLTRWVANEFVPFWQNLKDAYGKRNDPVSELPVVEPPQQEPAEEDIHEVDEIEISKTLNTYTEDRILRFTSSVATVIACLFPTVAISVLAKLHETAELLGLIAVFTAIFAIGLMFLTGSGTSRVEIFTATAAFSAVLVVFVQNQNGGSYNGNGNQD